MAEYVPGQPVQQARQSYNRQNQRSSVTTSMLSLWDANQSGLKLNVAALDSGLSLAFWVPHVGSDGKRTYPREQRFSTILTLRNTMAIETMIKDNILTAYENGKDSHCSIFTNSSRSTLLEIACSEGEFFATLYLNVDPASGISQSSVKFKFESTAYNTAYDQTTGVFSTTQVQADFFIFLKTIEGFNKLCAGTVAGHGSRMASSFDTTRLMSYIQSIANAVHAQLPAPSYNTSSTANYGNHTASMPSTPNQAPPMTEVDDLSDLM